MADGPAKIVAFGGGGFALEPENPQLDKLILRAAGSLPRPKVCFLPTASGDAPGYAKLFADAYGALGAETSVLTLAPRSHEDLAAHLLAQDVIHVGGGDTALMLKAWREYGVDRVLAEAYARGILLSGMSAGSICWFEAGLDEKIVPCLGFVKGSQCVHVDTDPMGFAAYKRHVAAGRIMPGYALEDGVAMVYEGGELRHVVSSRPGARAWFVGAKNGIARETELVVRYLGGDGILIRRAAESDAVGIHEAHHRSVREIAARDYSKEQIQAWTHRPLDSKAMADLESQIRNDFLWVVEKDGKVEGYAHMRTPLDIAPAAYLHALYLTPAVSGQGWGKRLMQLAENEAVYRGHPTMCLHASKTAVKFYESIGYEASGGAMRHTVAGVALECFPMKKALPVS